MFIVIGKTRRDILKLYEQDKKSYKRMLVDKAKQISYVTKEDIDKMQTIAQYHSIMKLRQKHVIKVLKSYITANVATQTFIEQIFECKFNENETRKILEEENFIHFAMKANLINRIIGIEHSSEGQVKLRVYAALVNYNKIKKELA